MRFTRKGVDVYAILLGKPSVAEVVIEDLTASEGATVSLLGTEAPLPYRGADGDFLVTLPGEIPDAHAYALKLSIR